MLMAFDEASLVAQLVKNPPAMWETLVQSLGPPSPGLLLPTFFIIGILVASVGEGNGTPLQYSCLENPMDGGVW